MATTEQLVLQQGCWPGFAVESAAARICREARARVSLDVRVQDMDLARPDALDNRRLEVVSPPLPLSPAGSGHTLVSALRRDGVPHSRAATTMVPCWTQLEVAKNGFTRSSRASSVAPVWLSLQAKSRAGGQTKAMISSVSWRKRKRGENPAPCGPEHAKLAGTGGRRSWFAVLVALGTQRRFRSGWYHSINHSRDQ